MLLAIYVLLPKDSTCFRHINARNMLSLKEVKHK